MHYNSWYDIGTGQPFGESAALEVVKRFTTELISKRGVQIDGYLMDDGWDDHQSLWRFHKGWPNGFTNLAAAAAAGGSSIGVWLSPWGGYAGRGDRIAAARADGFEIKDSADGSDPVFVLSGPKYYARFRETVLEFIDRYNVSMFKFDGIGSQTGVGHDAFTPDFAAAMKLLREIRERSKDIWINLSTGTWASPFWLLHADCVWRRGHDHYFRGEGPPRERWITYRDGETYRNIVEMNPLFPLSSVMLHGTIFARSAWDLNKPNQSLHFVHDVRAAAGAGTMLQELYITPGLLGRSEWDAVAEAITFVRAHRRLLVDTHWVGGDPNDGEVYGWAAHRTAPHESGFSVVESVLTLRNPNMTAASIPIDPNAVFELGDPAPLTPRGYVLRSPYLLQRVQTLELSGGSETLVTLAPFEVMTWYSSNII